jgi:chorismate mutase/prephenate dehydratase
MQKIEQLREKIEKIDAAIIEHLAARKILSEQIGQLKIDMGKAVLDPAREEYLLKQHKKVSLEYGLDPLFVTELFKIIFSYSHSLQKS